MKITKTKYSLGLSVTDQNWFQKEQTKINKTHLRFFRAVLTLELKYEIQ